MEIDSKCILLDACCSDSVVKTWLSEQGYDVKVVYKRWMTDAEVIEWAKREGRLIITYDTDFAGYDWHSKGASYRNVLLIRHVGSFKSGARLAVIKHIFENYSDEKIFGNFSTFRAGKLATRENNYD